MKAALVRGKGQTPVYGDFAEPVAEAGERLVHVTAAALSPLVRARASGAHYSSSGQFPFVAGVDGAGRLDDGRRVVFLLPRPPFGAMAERTVVPEERCVAIPDGLDDATAAAMANPGMSSWAAFVERAKLKTGETVLINGATGAAGRLAVPIAKYLGAKKVIATGRNEAVLRSLAAVGADVTIPLSQDGDALETRLKEEFAAGVDVVLDYLWGPSAQTMLIAAAKAGRDGVPIRVVQIGSIGGAEISLPGAVLRSTAIELMGSGIGSVSLERLLAAVESVLQAAVPGKFTVATQQVPLSDVERAWSSDDAAGRIVFTV
ncbi:MAG TPA: zinc-binding alcohol dehydrogenase family protein [Rhizomicrobium sp.]|nr:zinc-binding alcohol dehydrogenase family protein [Rhizomicrobium sp.]